MRILSWAAWRCLAALFFVQSWSAAPEEAAVGGGMWSLVCAIPSWAWLVAAFAASVAVFVATALAALEGGDGYPDE
jgi:hypothetical protein